MSKSDVPQIIEETGGSLPSVSIETSSNSDSYVQQLYRGLASASPTSSLSPGNGTNLLGGSTSANTTSKARSTTQIFTNSLPSAGLLNFASGSTMFATSPGFSPSSFSLARSIKLDHSAETTAHAEATWSELSQRVLPLFNGEGLRGSIEDLNEMVRVCLRAFTMIVLSERLGELMKNGCNILNNKLNGVPNEKLGSRLMEIWSFFFGTVLPYFQGVFIPLQLELKSLDSSTPNDILVRTILITAYRNHLILPIMDKICDAFQKTMNDPEESRRSPDTIPRMLQMLTILSELKDAQQPIVEHALRRLKDDMKKYNRASHMGRSDNPTQ